MPGRRRERWHVARKCGTVSEAWGGRFLRFGHGVTPQIGCFCGHVVLKCRTVTSELLVPRPRCYPSESRGTRIIRIRIVFFRPLAKNAAAFGGEEASEATISTARRDPAGRPQWNPSWPAR